MIQIWLKFVPKGSINDMPAMGHKWPRSEQATGH